MIGNILGHYQVMKKIGSGAMGEVYLARDQNLERDVALKFLPLQSLGQPKEVDRFLNEAKAAAAIAHPHIYTIHETNETDQGQKFLVMEHYPGQDLKAKLREGPLSLDTTLDIVYRLAHALACTHSKGIFHRDIKPANIMVGDPYNVIILDFGLAKIAKESTWSHSQHTRGTTSYMSPEQARGDRVDHRTDIWSLGVVLYEMLTGEKPYPGDFPDAVIYSILNNEPRALSRHHGNTKLRSILAKMLQKHPDNRYQHMDEVLKDLEPLIQKHSSPINLLPRRPSSRKRKKWLAWTLPLALILLLTAFIQNLTVPEDLLFAGRKSVAVLPFENLTGDPALSIWTTGLPRLIETELGRSENLYVLNSQAAETVYSTLGSLHSASLSPPFLKDFSQRTNVEALVLGSIMKAGSMYRVQVQLQDPRSGELMTTGLVESATEDAFFATADSLSALLRNYLEIAEIEEDLSYGKRHFAAGTQSAPAYRAFLTAYESYRKREWGPAKVGFEKALEHDPQYLNAQYWLVWTYRQLGQPEQMQELFTKVQDRQQDLPPIEQYSLAVMAAILEKDHWGAIQNLRKVVDRDPQLRGKWGQLGSLYLSVEESELARDALEQAMDLTRRWGDDFQWVHIYRNLAQVYVEAGDFDQAIEVARQGLETGEQNQRSMLFWLSAANIAKGDQDEARQQLDLFRQELRSRGMNDVIIAMNVGLVHVKAGKPQLALPEMIEESGANPDFFPAISWLATMHHKADQSDQGIACLDQFLDKNPEHQEAWARKARLQVESGLDLDEGIATLERLRQSNPELVDAEFMSSLGFGHQQSGHSQLALAALEESWQVLKQYDHKIRLRLDAAQAGVVESRN